ncbi:MAG: NAD(P)-binding domain-containing protein [Kineosporiaceae bacterium]
MSQESPVVVVGAGPAGLATAVHLLVRGVEPLVLEAGGQAGAAIREWGHIRLFSAWSELVDRCAADLLAPTGWPAPDPVAYPTGREWADLYLQPLADALGDRFRYRTRVTGIARYGRDLLVTDGRDREPLSVHVRSDDGPEDRLAARAVIDASGTWTRPNPLGADGLPALGETDPHVATRLNYRDPDLDDPAVTARYAGRHIALAGSGHSALTALVALAELAGNHPGTRITWLLRRGTDAAVQAAFGGGTADQLPARGALGLRARAAVESGVIDVRRGFRTAAVDVMDTGTLRLTADDGSVLDDLDEVIALTGFRPDLTWLSEVRLDLDPVLQAPRKLAPLIDPNVHSCGSVPPHGASELATPEPGLYVVGMKSYGRAPTFLALTGYEQVRSVAAELAGDHEAAARVELELPETGVCGGSGLFDDDAKAGSSCCAPATRAPGVAVLAGTIGLRPGSDTGTTGTC